MLTNYSTQQTRDTSNEVFKLLQLARGPISPHSAFIEIQGDKWTVTEYRNNPPTYTCISYAWGDERTANPLDNDESISKRAILCLEAAIKAIPTTEDPDLGAIWLDAFCVPFQNPARATCLQRLGAIYAGASQVIVVLSKPCAPILEQINTTKAIEISDLALLENDEWVSRAWTYQEIANSEKIYFIAEEGDQKAVKGSVVLDVLGQAMIKYRKLLGGTIHKNDTKYSRLELFEDVMADYLFSSYPERSVYQIMAGMDRRESKEPDDHIHAMIGAINTDLLPYSDSQTSDLHEKFMEMCEKKGDFSFIYCKAPRSTAPGKCWRPIAGLLHPVLPWHTTGKGQSADLYDSHITLHDMRRMPPGEVNFAAIQFVKKWLHIDNGSHLSPDEIATTIFERLKDCGFTGCGQCLQLEGGYFFPQSPLSDINGIVAFVASGVQWVFGAAGLLIKETGLEIKHYHDVGVFVGPVPTCDSSISLGGERK